MFNPDKSITLLELLIAIALLSVIILALSGVDFFSRSHVIDSDRRATLQNEVSRVLEHMSKEIVRAIGNMAIAGQNPIDLTNILGDTAIRIFVDQDQDGQISAGDRWIAYRYNAASFQIWYCPQCTDISCTTCIPLWGDTANVIAHHISLFNPSVIDNCVEVRITACWNPAAADCGTVNNPHLTMHTHIKMPSVSTN